MKANTLWYLRLSFLNKQSAAVYSLYFDYKPTKIGSKNPILNGLF